MKVWTNKSIKHMGVIVILILIIILILIAHVLNITLSQHDLDIISDIRENGNTFETVKTKQISYTYVNYYLNKKQHVYKSQFEKQYYSDIDMKLKQGDHIIIDTIVTTHEVCRPFGSDFKCEVEHYLKCNELNIDEKVPKIINFGSNEQIVDSLYFKTLNDTLIGRLRYINFYILVGAFLYVLFLLVESIDAYVIYKNFNNDYKEVI